MTVTGLYSIKKTRKDSWTPYTTNKGASYYNYSPYIQAEENWSDFVERTCSEASDFMRNFKPASPIFTPESHQVGFLLMWESEEALAQMHEQRTAWELANRSALPLEDEITQFQSWAASQLSEGEYSCWETGYPNWPQIKQAFGEFLQKQPFRDWNSRTVSDILYIIARDNDSPSLALAVAEEPERLLFLVEAAAKSSERDAKWQFAVEMSRLNRQEYPVEPLLLALFQDEDEYVRRQALMALGRMRSPFAEGLVAAAWETGDEYQRMAALGVLRDLNSPQLTSYLDKAKQAGSQYLSAYAARLKSGPA